MSTATLTSKGQITIPKDVRCRLNLHPGDTLDFAVEEDRRVSVSPVFKHVNEVFGLLSRVKPRETPADGQVRAAVSTHLRKRWR